MAESPIQLELQSHMQFKISHCLSSDGDGVAGGRGTCRLHSQTLLPSWPSASASGAGREGGVAGERQGLGALGGFLPAGRALLSHRVLWLLFLSR